MKLKNALYIMTVAIMTTSAAAEEVQHQEQNCPNLTGTYESDGVRSEVKTDRDSSGTLQLRIQEKNFVLPVNGKASTVDGLSTKAVCNNHKAYIIWHRPGGVSGEVAYSLDGKNNLVAELFNGKDVALKVIAIRVK